MELCNNHPHIVNCGWHDSAHIRDTPPVGFFNPIRHARALKGIFSSLAFRKAMARFIVIRVVYTRIEPSYILVVRLVPAAIYNNRTSFSLYSKRRFSKLQLSTKNA